MNRSTRSQGIDPRTLERHFGTADDLLALWIAEPSLSLAPAIEAALGSRAETGWYGYEMRPEPVIGAFWNWMAARHDWTDSGLSTLVSPSVGTSIGVLIEQFTNAGDGVILQPPVFTDFKPLVVAGGRTVVRNALLFDQGQYRIDYQDLAVKAADPANRMLILCSPHNPVGRVWTAEELRTVASICAEHDVFVVADEIHADVAIAPHKFVPFGVVASDIDVEWAATHGPIKTFGLAGVCDTLVVTASETVSNKFESRSSQLHLTRNNVFGLAAFEAGYRGGAAWLDDLVALLSRNIALLQERLPSQIKVVVPEGTYLAWLDLRQLDLDVPEIPRWLGSAGVALSPGHWFGREGAGFARMTIAAPTDMIEQAADRLAGAAVAL